MHKEMASPGASEALPSASVPEPTKFQATADDESTATDGQVDQEQKSKDSFWFGVVVGVIVWVCIIVIGSLLYCCCCKKQSESDSSQVDQANYNNLPGSQQQ